MDEALEVVSDLRDRNELEKDIRLFYAHRAHTSHRHHNGGLWESTEAIAQLPVKLRRKIVVSLSSEMLGKVPLFENSDLKQDFVEELIFTMEAVTFSPKEFLFFQGDVGDCMYIIVDGQIDVYITKDGEEGGKCPFVQCTSKSSRKFLVCVCACACFRVCRCVCL